MAGFICSVLDSDGNSFTVTNVILDSDGNAFTVSGTVLNSAGTAFVVCTATAVQQLNNAGGADPTEFESPAQKEDKLLIMIVKEFVKRTV